SAQNTKAGPENAGPAQREKLLLVGLVGGAAALAFAGVLAFAAVVAGLAAALAFTRVLAFTSVLVGVGHEGLGVGRRNHRARHHAGNSGAHQLREVSAFHALHP